MERGGLSVGLSVQQALLGTGFSKRPWVSLGHPVGLLGVTEHPYENSATWFGQTRVLSGPGFGPRG